MRSEFPGFCHSKTRQKSNSDSGYPRVLGDPNACEGYVRQIDRLLRHADKEPLVAERVATIDLMLAMVAAGCALGLAGAYAWKRIANIALPSIRAKVWT